MQLRAQGATEYLVLLAVVLIVALVSVALLGFFPGMASDAQITQSQMYWRSASPIAIIETAAKANIMSGSTYVYLRVKNNGNYPIRITGVVGADGGKATAVYSGASAACGTPSDGYYNISDLFYLAPGEEKYFTTSMFGAGCIYELIFRTTASSPNMVVGGASSVCQNSTTAPGTAVMNNLGFEYIQYMEGQQITKKQIGKQMIIKCLPQP